MARIRPSSIITTRFAEGPERNRALSIYTAVIAAATVIGQGLGGMLVSADIASSGWRPVFLVNVPIGIILLIVGRQLRPSTGGNRDRAPKQRYHRASLNRLPSSSRNDPDASSASVRSFHVRVGEWFGWVSSSV